MAAASAGSPVARAPCQPNRQPHRSRAALFLSGAVFAAARAAFPRGRTFAAPTPPTASPSLPVGAGKSANSPAAVAHLLGGGAAAAAAPSWPPAWALAGAVGALAAVCLMRGGRPKSAAPVPSIGVTLSGPMAEEPTVVMHTAGGRRKRLGVGGRVCMLTGRKKKKVIRRTFSEKANKRYMRPNTRWKKLWWDREKKWVRLYVSCRAIKMVDKYGLEKMAFWAGLDLYAWCKPHWMPGSRQPLALRIGYSPKARNDQRRWPDYLPKLNKGAALADITPAPEPSKPHQFKPKPWTRVKGPGTPPKTQGQPFEPRRLDARKFLTVPADQTM